MGANLSHAMGPSCNLRSDHRKGRGGVLMIFDPPLEGQGGIPIAVINSTTGEAKVGTLVGTDLTRGKEGLSFH